MTCCNQNCNEGRVCPMRRVAEPKGAAFALLCFVAINTVLVALGVVKLVELFV